MFDRILESRSELIKIIGEVRNFDRLEEELNKKLNKDNICHFIFAVQVIPEFYNPSSTHEKMWAKASDIILAKSLEYIGLETRVIRVRGDDADVFAEYKGEHPYSLVGDAKCFRLSRTAKNQKDFKVSSMADWRRSNTFAVLCAPFFSYPKDKSQVYRQAGKSKVCLISYLHLSIAIRSLNADSLRRILSSKTISDIGRDYWDNLNDVFLREARLSLSYIIDLAQIELELLKIIKDMEINYYENLKNRIKNLDRSILEKEYIRLLRIDERIKTMEKTIRIHERWIGLLSNTSQ